MKRKRRLEDLVPDLAKLLANMRQSRDQARAIELALEMLATASAAEPPTQWATIRALVSKATSKDDVGDWVADLLVAIDSIDDSSQALANPRGAWSEVRRGEPTLDEILEALKTEADEDEERASTLLGTVGIQVADRRGQDDKQKRGQLARDLVGRLELLFGGLLPQLPETGAATRRQAARAAPESGQAAKDVWLLIQNSGLAPIPIATLLGIRTTGLATSAKTAKDIIADECGEGSTALATAYRTAGRLLGVDPRTVRTFADGY